MRSTRTLSLWFKLLELRDEVSKHVEEAKKLAETFRNEAESTEESEYKSAQEIEGVRRQIYLAAAAETAEKFGHLKMSEALSALRCVTEGNSSSEEDVIDSDAEVSDMISQMTAQVKSAIDEARLYGR